jgi:adenylylsulfate kinase
METHLRSVVKGMSWRLVATVVTTIVVFIYSGELAAAAIVGSVDAVAKIGLYWGHERIWQRIHWGRIVPTVSSP